MPTTYSRVTVVNGARRVDLALPSALPLADVMPRLLGFCAPEGEPGRPVGWTLGRVGGVDIPLASTLADAGVADGEVLELRTGKEPVRPAYVEDVRDALEDAVDQSAQPWQPCTTLSFALTTAAVGLAGAALLPGALRPAAPGALIAALVVAALLVVAAGWAAGRGHAGPAHGLLAVAALWGGVAGWLGATFLAWPVGAGVAAAMLGGLVVAAAARAVTAAATGHLAALAVVGGAAVVTGAADLARLDPLTGVRLAAVSAVLVMGALPRASLAAGGLASADYLVRHQGRISEAELTGRIRRSTALLYGGIAGAGVVGVAAGVLLALSDSAWDQALGAITGVALVLRSRVFSRVPHIVPVRAAGLIMVAAQVVRWVHDTPAIQTWSVPLAVMAAGTGVGLSAVPLSDVARARVKRALHQAELVAVVATIPVAAAALGLFEWVAAILPG